MSWSPQRLRRLVGVQALADVHAHACCQADAHSRAQADLADGVDVARSVVASFHDVRAAVGVRGACRWLFMVRHDLRVQALGQPDTPAALAEVARLQCVAASHATACDNTAVLQAQLERTRTELQAARSAADAARGQADVARAIAHRHNSDQYVAALA